MKRLILYLIISLGTIQVNSQTLIDKGKEEQIRKNLTDYKNLIVEHKKTIKEVNDLKIKLDALNKELDECKQAQEAKPKQSKLKTLWLKIKKLFSKK